MWTSNFHVFSARFQGGPSSSLQQSSMKKMWSMFSGMGSEGSESKALHSCEYYIFGFVHFTWRGNTHTDIGSLSKEVSGLEEVSKQLFLDYVDMLSLKVIFKCAIKHCCCHCNLFILATGENHVFKDTCRKIFWYSGPLFFYLLHIQDIYCKWL